MLHTGKNKADGSEEEGNAIRLNGIRPMATKLNGTKVAIGG